MLENMIDYVRISLYVAIAIVGFFLFQAWEKEHPKQEVTPASVAQTEAIPGDRFIPAGAETKTASTPVAPAAPVTAVPAQGQIIKVTTDLLDVSIDTRGGDIVAVKLLKYPESLGSKTPFTLLNDDQKTRYIAESGLLSEVGPDTPKEQALYTSPQTQYALNPNDNSLVVTLTWQKNGLKVNKIYTFVRNSYEVKVGYNVVNQSNQPWQGSLYTQLMRTNVEPENHGGLVNLTTYFGAAISTPQKPFEKITFKDMQEGSLNRSVQGGWAAMIQHYFISAWVPAKGATTNYYSKVTPGGLYTIGMISQPLSAAPGAQVSTEAKLYTGPAIADLLEKTAPGLKLTIDYGWFWFISDIIFWMMQQIYNVVGNWGWAIVLVTVVIKLFFYPLSNKSYRSMSKMKNLQPKIEALKERYGDDKQKMTQATLELYKQEKVNPMTGCLPVLIQIPVFIALYWVLVESVQLRQAPFIFWIHDLSQKDPYYVLPILMCISMFIQQRLNPPPPDPTQAKVMLAIPFIFAVLFKDFPAGLMLYWVVNNTLSFMQQWHIMHRVNKETSVKK